MRLLCRLGVGPDLVEVHELAAIFGLFLGPDLLHGEHPLAEHAPAPLERRAMVLHLLGVPASTDPEDEPPVRQTVEGGDFLGGRDGIAFHDQADAGGEAEPRRDRRSRRQRHEGVVRVPILLGQVRTPGPRAPPARRDVHVLGHPERFEPALLERPGELGRLDRVLGGKHRHAEVHGILLRVRAGIIGPV